MSGNRYTEAAAEYFGENNDDDSSERASEGAGTDGEVVENPTSAWYVGMRHVEDVVRAYAKAHPEEAVNGLDWGGQDDSDLPVQVRWAKAVHEVTSALGDRQRTENPFSIAFGEEGGYHEAFGDSLPSIEAEPIDGGVLATLEARIGATDQWDQEGFDALGRGGPILVPVIDGETLPPFVRNESELNEALATLAKVPTEPETAEPAGIDLDAFEEAAVATGMGADVLDANMEGYPTPNGMTVDDVRDQASDLRDTCVLRTMLEVEEATKDRKTAKEAIEARLRALGDGEDGVGTDSAAEEFFGESTTGNGGEPAPNTGDISKATRLEMAMDLVENEGYDIAEAKAEVGL